MEKAMATSGETAGMDMKTRLSMLWVFMLLNYLYCDVLGLFDPTISKDLAQDALLAGAILMEVPIAMVLLSRVLGHGPNRWANIGAGAFMAVVQLSTLFVGTPPTLYYLCFSVIEIASLLFIVGSAWRWTSGDVHVTSVAVGRLAPAAD
jgi:hypothetical protein